jgi:PAS domain S-box-containing protein
MDLPVAVAYLSGPDLVIGFASNAWRRLAGGREVIGVPVRKAFPELAGQGGFDVLDRVIRTGQPTRGSEIEVRVNRGRRAERLFVDLACQPVRDSAGGISGVLVHAADVTAHVHERRRHELLAAQASEAQERYRTLFETLPQGIICYRGDGSVFAANPAATRILGLEARAMTTWPLGTGGQPVREDGTPYRPEELPAQTALRTGEVVHDMIVGKPHARTGELRWLRVTAVPDERDSSGRPQRAYAIFTDLTEQYQMEAELRESTSLLGRLRDANVLGVVLVGEERVYEANDAFLDIVGYTRGDVDAGRISYKSLTPPEWAGRDRDALAQLHRNGAFQPYDKEYVHRDGRRVPVLVGAAVVNRRPLRWVTFVVDLTARQRGERERAELLLRERAARDEAGKARERLAFLLNAGALAAATRDRQELLEQMTELVVPGFADYCVVFLPAGNDRLRVAALTHRDPARAAAFGRLREHPITVTGPMTAQVAYRTGTVRLAPDVSAELPGWREAEPALADVLERSHPQSALAAPLTAAGQRLGVMVMGRDTDRARFADPDVAVAEELSRRLAAALANADAFAREHSIAETLQRSLLPDALPAIPGLDLAVRYLPATDGAAVGGDWYDAFPVDANRVGLVIGDVIGHNITSASGMGQIRTMLRAYALDNPSPGDLLRRTNQALARLLPDAMATVACAVLDLATGDLSYASAGHPPPLLTTGTGTEYLDGVTGVMLGTGIDAAYPAGRRRLPAGSGLLLYTDGLIEDRRRDISAGLGALAGALRQSAAGTADQMCTAAQQAMLGTAPRADDVCLLAVRTPG